LIENWVIFFLVLIIDGQKMQETPIEEFIDSFLGYAGEEGQ